MAKHRNMIIYEFGLVKLGLHYTWRYYDKERILYGSQHFTSFKDAENCPIEKLIFKELKHQPRCMVCNAK